MKTMDFGYAIEQGKDMLVKQALPLIVGTIVIALLMSILKK